MKRLLGIIGLTGIFALAFTLGASPAYAFDVRTGETVTVEKGTTVRGTFVATATDLVVRGTVDGDLICAAKSVTVTGRIVGDVLCAGQSLDITGTVDGNVRVAGQHVTVGGTVARNVSVVSQQFNLDREGKTGGDVYAAGQDILVDGVVARDLAVQGQRVKIEGKVGRNGTVQGDDLTVAPGAGVRGTLTYDTANDAEISNEATISGKVTREHGIDRSSGKTATKTLPKRAADSGLAGILFATALGLVLVALFGPFTASVTDRIEREPLMASLAGFLFLISVPVAIVILLFTIIGIPVAILAGVLYAFLIMVSRLFVGLIVGKKIMEAVKTQKASVIWPALVGIPVLFLVFRIPVLGGLASFLAVIAGLGGLTLRVVDAIKANKRG